MLCYFSPKRNTDMAMIQLESHYVKEMMPYDAMYVFIKEIKLPQRKIPALLYEIK